MECYTTETLQRHVVVIDIFENNHQPTSVVVDVFTPEQQTTSVAIVTISWYKLVRYVVKTTVIPYMLVTVTHVVMEYHIIITLSIVCVEHSIMIIQENVVEVKWYRRFRCVVETLCQVVFIQRTPKRNVVEITMFLYQAYVVSLTQGIGR